MNESEPKKNLVLSDAIIAITLTASTYAIAFAYEAGKADYYNFPREFIGISATLLLNTFGVLLIWTLPFLNASQSILSFLPRSKTRTSRTIKKFTLYTLITGTFFSPILKNGEGWIQYSILISAVAFFAFVVPLITQRKVAGYENKLEAQARDQNKEGSPGNALIARIGTAPLLFIAMVCGASIFSFLLGQENAKKRTDYFALKSDQTKLVISQYDNLMIIGTIDPKSSQLTGEITAIKLGDGKEIELRLIKTEKIKQHTFSATVQKTANTTNQ